MITGLLALFVILLLVGCVVANRYYVPPEFEQADINGAAADQPAPGSVDRLSVTTWNIGYAGMGAESDFTFDGGEQRRPLSGELVDRNLAEIEAGLRALESDVILLQEVADPSWLTYGRDVLSGVVGALPDHAWTFGADVNPRFVPPPYSIRVGNAIFSRLSPASAERRGLPLEPTFELGLFRKGYRMHIIRIDPERSWVIINIHLSTFDSAEDDVRGAQVDALLEFAEAEYAKGNHVVIGGDWNLRLAETHFPNASAEETQFWVRDFPQSRIPEGWRFAVDDSVPTVRGAYKPYVQGENFALVIDGFLVSPNVSIDSVTTTDYAFAFTDHHPVSATFTAVGAGPS